MTSRKITLVLAAAMVAALVAAIIVDGLGIAESAIMTGFVVICISLIAFDAKQTIRARLGTYAMLAVGAAVMFAPIAIRM